MNRRTTARRRADRQFLHLLIGGALLTFFIGVSVGYWYAARQADLMFRSYDQSLQNPTLNATNDHRAR